jgi:HK97 family phage prohead protease
MVADFSGYATKVGMKCTDGRIIAKDAFAKNHKTRVPLVWQHQADSPENILGHADLENRSDGVYAYGFFNENPKAKEAKELVRHGDIVSMSIYANKLIQQQDTVLHGDIKEVSLVLSGANPGAIIDNISFKHSDGYYESEVNDPESAIIYLGGELKHEEGAGVAEEKKTLEEFLGGLDDHELSLIDELLEMDEDPEEDPEDADNEDSSEAEHNDNNEGESDLIHEDGAGARNIFTNDNKNKMKELSHEDKTALFDDAEALDSLQGALLKHAATYGIDNMELLFPDYQKESNTPTTIDRDTTWVGKLINRTKHLPFAKIKHLAIDITAEEARALGYVKGNRKKEEVVRVMERDTDPQTIYKKQSFDRDDLIDMKDFDAVGWIWPEMRGKVYEEIARAALIGDGRDISNVDKIKEDKIRPIYQDDEFYTFKIDASTATTVAQVLEYMVAARAGYRGKGTPVVFIDQVFHTAALMIKDNIGRRIFNTDAELAAYLRVSEIIDFPYMNQASRTDDDDVVWKPMGIFVNPSDYRMGTNKGGQLVNFEDFDIHYNKYYYLIETRLSGSLMEPLTAYAIERKSTAPALTDPIMSMDIPNIASVMDKYFNPPTTGTTEPASE